jgi:hypothetical protein
MATQAVVRSRRPGFACYRGRYGIVVGNLFCHPERQRQIKKLVNGSGLCFQLAQVFDNRDRAWLKEQFESLRQRELLILARVNDILNVASQNLIPELETVIKRLSKQAKSIDDKVPDA